MDVDAGERGAARGGSGGDAQRHPGGAAGTGRGPVREHRELYIIEEPETPAARSIPRLLASLPGETRESAWRTFLRWLAKHSSRDRMA